MTNCTPRFLFLLPHPRQLFIQLRCAAAGVFYADKGAVQDAHAVRIHRQQKLLIFGIVIKADGDRLHRKGIVGVGRIVLVQFLRQETVESNSAVCWNASLSMERR